MRMHIPTKMVAYAYAYYYGRPIGGIQRRLTRLLVMTTGSAIAD